MRRRIASFVDKTDRVLGRLLFRSLALFAGVLALVSFHAAYSVAADPEVANRLAGAALPFIFGLALTGLALYGFGRRRRLSDIEE